MIPTPPLYQEQDPSTWPAWLAVDLECYTPQYQRAWKTTTPVDGAAMQIRRYDAVSLYDAMSTMKTRYEVFQHHSHRYAANSFDDAVSWIEFRRHKEVVAALRDGEIKGGYCPICSTPLRSFTQLLGHLIRRHRGTITTFKDYRDIEVMKCACGKQTSSKGMIQHLHRAGNLKDHFAVAALALSAKAASKP